MKCDEISQFIVKRDASIGDLRKQESSETVITENGKVNLLGIHRQLWLYWATIWNHDHKSELSPECIVLFFFQ